MFRSTVALGCRGCLYQRLGDQYLFRPKDWKANVKLLQIKDCLDEAEENNLISDFRFFDGRIGLTLHVLFE